MAAKTAWLQHDVRLGVALCAFHAVARAFPVHFHDYHVMGRIGAGSRRIVCNGRTWLAEAGDLVMFNPLDRHACTGGHATLLDWQALHIPADAMRRLMPAPDGKPPYFAVTLLRNAGLARCFEACWSRLVRGQNAAGMLTALLRSLPQRHSAGDMAAPFGSAGRAGLAEACAYMERHYASPLRLEDIGRAAGMGRYGLVRAFRRHMGITPWRYLETIRIARAGTLLAQGMPVAAVALESGFADQSHLTRIFKRFMGVTPGSYRCGYMPVKKNHAKLPGQEGPATC